LITPVSIISHQLGLYTITPVKIVSPQGPSTITQQLIKISTPQKKRTPSKKLSEIMLARRLETRWSKDQILTAYLNRLDYGSHRQGCAEAARYFFKKPLTDLSLAEAALLAALPQAPSRLNPRHNPQAALERRNWILDRLTFEFDYPSSQIEIAKSEPLQLATLRAKNPIPHLSNRFSEGAQLSIDSDLQRKTHDILGEELSKLDQKNVQHGAIVVIENTTGEILAFHGSSDFESSNSGPSQWSSQPALRWLHPQTLHLRSRIPKPRTLPRHHHCRYSNRLSN
jgi:penicillin-binding protein 1C